MISYKDIYKRAIKLFDDPIIQKAYVEDKVRFHKLMYPHLMNGLDLFNNPSSVSLALLDQTDPVGQLETLVGDGGDTYTLTITPAEGSDMSYIVNGVYDKKASYDPENHTVTFSKVVPEGIPCSVEWYSCGCFNTDFTSVQSPTMSASAISAKVTDILARALVLNWATEEQNYLLDIKNILTDTDFKLYSPANSIRAKCEWVNKVQNDFDTLTNKFSWNLYSRAKHGGRYYGN